MSVKRIMRIVIAILLITFMIGIIKVRFDNRGGSLDFFEKFGVGYCQRACWNGIEPGRTTRATVNDILLDNNISYSYVDGLLGDVDSVYNIWVAQQEQVEIGQIVFKDDIVAQITLPIQICVLDVVDIYGTSNNVQQSDNFLYLIYPEHGLVFSINSSDDMFPVSIIFFVSESTIRNFTDRDNPLVWEAFWEDKVIESCPYP